MKALDLSLPQDRTRAILRSGLDAQAKLVAVAISDHLGPQGQPCFPRVATLAEESSLSERTVQDVIRWGAEAGWLLVEERRGMLSRYSIDWTRLAGPLPDRRSGGRRRVPDESPVADDDGGANPREGRTPAAGAPLQGSHRCDPEQEPPQGAHPTPAGGAPPSEATREATREATTLTARPRGGEGGTRLRVVGGSDPDPEVLRVYEAWLDERVPGGRAHRALVGDGPPVAVQVQVIRRAMRSYTVEDLVLVVGWAHRGTDERALWLQGRGGRQYLGLAEILDTRRIGDRVERALAWRQSAAPVAVAVEVGPPTDEERAAVDEHIRCVLDEATGVSGESPTEEQLKAERDWALRHLRQGGQLAGGATC